MRTRMHPDEVLAGHHPDMGRHGPPSNLPFYVSLLGTFVPGTLSLSHQNPGAPGETSNSRPLHSEGRACPPGGARRVCRHSKISANLLNGLRSNSRSFSEGSLISKEKHLDFDSAIPRFESWRPSQPVNVRSGLHQCDGHSRHRPVPRRSRSRTRAISTNPESRPRRASRAGSAIPASRDSRPRPG